MTARNRNSVMSSASGGLFLTKGDGILAAGSDGGEERGRNEILQNYKILKITKKLGNYLKTRHHR